MRDLIFSGLETSLSEDERQRIVSNVESMMAATSRSAARSTLDSDIVLVAVNENGEEERVRAASLVMRRMSSGFEGLLQECDCQQQEIKMCAPAPIGQIKLHQIAAVRWVLEVLHAVDAHNAAGANLVPSGPIAAHVRKSGLSSGPTPPLSLLLAACQIADCWDCPAVLSVASYCVMDSLANGMVEDFAGMARSVIKLLQLVPQRPPKTIEWSQLQEAIELALARLVPANRLASMLKHFEVEQVARVVNLMEDEEIVLTPLHLEGALAQGRGWANALKRNGKDGVSSEPTPKRPHRPRRLNREGFRVDRADGNCHANMYETRASQNRAELRASVRHAFAMKLDLVSPEAKEVSAADEMEEVLVAAYGDAWRHNPRTPAETVEVIDQLRGDKIGFFVKNVGAAPALIKSASFWMQEEGKPVHQLGEIADERPLAIPADQSFGWPRYDLMVEQLGTVQFGGTVIIHKLQRQFEVLARWQDVTSRRCERLPSRIVSCVKRLQADARLIEPKVQLRLDIKFGKYCVSAANGRYYPSYSCKPSLYVAGESDVYNAILSPACATLHKSMISYVTLRLDDHYGLVNRSVHALDRASVEDILGFEFGVAPHFSPKKEHTLLRMAVDWATQPGRSSADVASITSRIYFAALPSATLLHLDWNQHIRNALRKFCGTEETKVAARIQMGLARQQGASLHELGELCQKLDLQWGEVAPHQAGFAWTRFEEAKIHHLSTSKLFELTTNRARNEARLRQEVTETQLNAQMLRDHINRMDEI